MEGKTFKIVFMFRIQLYVNIFLGFDSIYFLPVFQLELEMLKYHKTWTNLMDSYPDLAFQCTLTVKMPLTLPNYYPSVYVLKGKRLSILYLIKDLMLWLSTFPCSHYSALSYCLTSVFYYTLLCQHGLFPHQHTMCPVYKGLCTQNVLVIIPYKERFFSILFTLTWKGLESSILYTVYITKYYNDGILKGLSEIPRFLI